MNNKKQAIQIVQKHTGSIYVKVMTSGYPIFIPVSHRDVLQALESMDVQDSICVNRHDGCLFINSM